MCGLIGISLGTTKSQSYSTEFEQCDIFGIEGSAVLGSHGCHHFKQCNLSGNKRGVLLDGDSVELFENCDISEGRSGMYLSECNYTASTVIFKECSLHDNKFFGVEIDNAAKRSAITFEKCYFFNNSGKPGVKNVDIDDQNQLCVLSKCYYHAPRTPVTEGGSESTTTETTKKGFGLAGLFGKK